MAGIADKDRTLVLDAQLLDRLQDGLRMRFGVGHVVAPDDDVEGVVEAGDAEAAHRAVAQLARDDAEQFAGVFQSANLVHDAFIGFHERVVVGAAARRHGDAPSCGGRSAGSARWSR